MSGGSSGTFADAMGVNVNPNNSHPKAGSMTGYSPGVSAGKGMLNFPNTGPGQPTASWFDKAANDNSHPKRKGPR